MKQINSTSYQGLPFSIDHENDVEKNQSVSLPKNYNMFAGIAMSALGVVLLFTIIAYRNVNSSMGSALGEIICDSTSYSKNTLKLAHEQSFMSLMKNTKGQYKFEASDVIIVNSSFYSICDNSWSIDKIGDEMKPFSEENIQIGPPARHLNQSGFEAIFYDNRRSLFYVVRESIAIADVTSKGVVKESHYHALVEEVRIDADERDYTVEQTCVTEFEFAGASKGFEGAIGLRDASGELYMLGLCEGNGCDEGKAGKDHGNGEAVLMRKVDRHVTHTNNNFTCEWQTVRKLSIPSTAYFQDYSSIAVNSNGRVAITSQEESQVWIGRLSHWTSPPAVVATDGNDDGEVVGRKTVVEGTFDPLLSQFEAANDGRTSHDVYNFPRAADCAVVYCNIEGIHWINDELLVAVSDQMKPEGKQGYRCIDKDQSIHVFVIPQEDDNKA